MPRRVAERDDSAVPRRLPPYAPELNPAAVRRHIAEKAAANAPDGNADAIRMYVGRMLRRREAACRPCRECTRHLGQHLPYNEGLARPPAGLVGNVRGRGSKSRPILAEAARGGTIGTADLSAA